MVGEIADDPHTAVDKEQHARTACDVFRLHDVDLDRATVLGDGLLGGGDTGHVYLGLALEAGEDLLRFGLR